jgi:plasmid stabilization system protein ParE
LIKIENIGQFPEKYPKRYDLTQKDYRFYNFKDCSLYVIYKIDEDSIKIIRIVSSKKDITNKI